MNEVTARVEALEGVLWSWLVRGWPMVAILVLIFVLVLGAVACVIVGSRRRRRVRRRDALLVVYLRHFNAPRVICIRTDCRAKRAPQGRAVS